MRKVYMLTALVIFTLVLLVACQPATPAPKELPVLKIGTQPWIGYGPWWISLEKGFFEKRGVKVELVEFVTDQDLNSGLASGQFDGANIATHTSAILYNGGVPVKLVLLEDASYEADAILAKEGINSIKDLKGKQVAYEEGSTSDLLLNYALMQNGMSLDDIVPVHMPASDAGAALIAGKVDAAVTYEPYISAALAKGGGVHVIYTAGEKPGLIGDFLAFPPSTLEKKGDAVRKMILAWQDALDYLDKHPDEGQKIIADAVGSDLEEFKTAWKGVKIYNLEENKQMMQGEIQETYKEVVEVLKATGAIEKAPDANEVITDEYLPK